MTTDTETERADVVVVGGGLAGLVAAAVAGRAGARTVLLDGHRLGGRARVDRVGGFAFNRGPRALYAGGPAERVLGELGVDTRAGAPPVLQGASVLLDGQLHLLPRSGPTLARTSLLGPGEKARFARRLATLGRLDPASLAGTSADEAIAGFGLGPVGRATVTALVRLNTYAAATDLLDASVAVTQLQAAAGAGVRYLDGGWQVLVDGLEAVARAAGVDVRADQAVRAVVPGPDDVEVLTADGRRLVAAAAVLAAGGPDAAAALLPQRPPAWDGAGPPVAAACLELGLRRPPATRFVLGIDAPLYFSTHAPPADLAPEGGAVVHAMRYLHPDDPTTADEARSELRALAATAGVAPDDVVEERFLARMVVAGGLPLATRGGRAGRPPVACDDLPGVLVAGDWVGSEGLLADAAVASGADAGRQAAVRAGTLAAA